MSNGTPEERFWRKVDRRGPDDCWDWKAALCRGGYGHFKIDKRVISAHRFSYELHFGPLEGLFCLHKCDNPKCVNPRHLFLGTQDQNMKDMCEKGRVSREEKRPNVKLSGEKIRAAKIYRLNGSSYARIAKRFNVSHTIIWRALNGKSWKSVM